jgi:hypothetical protein
VRGGRSAVVEVMTVPISGQVLGRRANENDRRHPMDRRTFLAAGAGRRHRPALAGAGRLAQQADPHDRELPARRHRWTCITRTVSQKLSEKWGQPVVVENRAGAGGNIGAQGRCQRNRRRLHLLVHAARPAHDQPEPVQGHGRSTPRSWCR